MEIRYAGIVVGRSGAVRDLDATGAFVGLAEPLPVGTMVALKFGDATKDARVDEVVDLAHRAKHLPKQLSGGQQQRVAVARALVSDPKVILVDEPTGNLDTANGDAVMQMLSGVAKSGTTIVRVTHSEAHANRADRVVYMLDGRFVDATEV